jgi:hypothetical protein
MRRIAQLFAAAAVLVLALMAASASAASAPAPSRRSRSLQQYTPPVKVMMVVAADATAAGFTSTTAQLLVRQLQQAKPCATSANPTVALVTPTCPSVTATQPPLVATANTRTILSTRNVNTSAFKVSWACVVVDAQQQETATTVQLVSPGVALAKTAGTGTTLTCTATVSSKPAPLKLMTAGVAGPSATAWSLTARQSTQGRACSVAATGGAASAAASAPICDLQPLLPGRSTVLSTSGLDSARYSVAWSCVGSTGNAVAVADVVGALNSKTVVLEKELGGGTVVCTATLAVRTEVLVLAASAAGAIPQGAKLTAKQAAQTTACTFAVSTTGAAPTCTDAVALQTGQAVALGATDLPASFFVSSWACDNGVSVTPGANGAASVSALPATGATTCIALIKSTVVPVKLAVPTAAALTFTAKQQSGGNSNVCTVASGAANAVDCSSANPSTATTLSVVALGSGSLADATFACTLVGGTAVPVSRLTGTTAVVMAPTAGLQMTCSVASTTSAGGQEESVTDDANRPPVTLLNLASNLPATLKVEYFGAGLSSAATNTCASSGAAQSLACTAGTGASQLPYGGRVKLSQTGLTAAGYYRWMCNSSAAAVVQAGGTGSDATATITLPASGSKPLSCALYYWVSKPSGMARRR